jgi:hypothetical protein
VVKTLTKVCGGAESTPTKISTKPKKRLSSVSGEKQKFQYKADVEEMNILNAAGDRVQGLSSEGISVSEEEMIYVEAQGSQTNTLESKGSQTLELSKCSYVKIVKSKGGPNVDSPCSGVKVLASVKEIESGDVVEIPGPGKKMEEQLKVSELASSAEITNAEKKTGCLCQGKGIS